MKRRTLAVASLIAASAILGGCAVTPSYETHYVETVRIAPPPPRIEYVGAPPVVGHVWIGGYWNWGGARYVWVPGRWEAPRHGHHWVPHRWEQHGSEWRRHGGHWQPEPHRAAPREVPRDHYDARHRRSDERPAPRPFVAPQVREDVRPPVRDERRDGWQRERESRPAPERRERDFGSAPRREMQPSAPHIAERRDGGYPQQGDTRPRTHEARGGDRERSAPAANAVRNDGSGRSERNEQSDPGARGERGRDRGNQQGGRQG